MQHYGHSLGIEQQKNQIASRSIKSLVWESACRRAGVRWRKIPLGVLKIGTYVPHNIRATSLHAEGNPHSKLACRDRSIRYDELRILKPVCSRTNRNLRSDNCEYHPSVRCFG